MPNFRALISLFLLYSQTKLAGIRWHYHESSDCFESDPQKSLLKSSHPKTCLPNFSTLPPPLPTPPAKKKTESKEVSNPKVFSDHPHHLTSGVPLTGHRVIQFINRLNGSETNMITVCCWKSHDYLWKAAIINRHAIILAKFDARTRSPKTTAKLI